MTILRDGLSDSGSTRTDDGAATLSHGNTRWTARAVSILREEWKKGTASWEIAHLLFTETGLRATKNSVLGKAHRLGLQTHALFPLKRAAPVQTIKQPPASGVPFAETTNRQCMWIEKDAKDNPVMCCGKKTALGQPWCPDHYSRCYRPPVPWERTAVRVPKPPKVEAA